MPTSHQPNAAERWLSSANAWVSARCEAALADSLSVLVPMEEIKESFEGEQERRL